LKFRAYPLVVVQLLLFAQPLRLPSEYDLGKVDSQLSVLGRRVRGQAHLLERRDYVVDERVSNQIVDAIVLDNDVEHVGQLRHRVVLFNEDLLGPRGQCQVAVVHAGWKRRGKDLKSLPNNDLGLRGVGLEQRVEHLQDDSLVDGELADDVAEEKVAVVFIEGVDAGLSQQTGPREGHETTELSALLLVVDIVDVVVSVLDEEGAELEEKDADGVGGGGGAGAGVRVDYFVDEDADEVVVGVRVGLGWASDELHVLVVLEAELEAGNEDVLEDVGFVAVGVSEGAGVGGCGDWGGGGC